MKTKNAYIDPTSTVSPDDDSLSKYRKEDFDLFAVPDGYFDSLADTITGKIKTAETAKKPAIKSIFRKKSFYLLAPAGIAAATLILVSVLRQPTTTTNNSTTDEIALAYDPTYAEEALLLESADAESQLAQMNQVGDLFTQDQLMDDAVITTYLNEQEIEPEIIQPQ